METTQPLIDEQRRNIEALNKEYKIFNSDFNKAELDLADLKSAIKAEKSDNSITVRNIFNYTRVLFKMIFVFNCRTT